MNEQTRQRHQRPARKPAKPGDLQFWTGILCVLAAPFVLYAVLFVSEEHMALKSNGLVTEAVVKGKSVSQESYTDRRGRPKSRAVYNMRVAYDLNAPTRYAAWKATGLISPSQYPAITTSDMPAPQSYYDDLAIGDTTTVIRDPATGTLLLTEHLEYETSIEYYLKWYLGLGAVFMAGLILTLMGWRKKRAYARCSQSGVA